MLMRDVYNDFCHRSKAVSLTEAGEFRVYLGSKKQAFFVFLLTCTNFAAKRAN